MVLTVPDEPMKMSPFFKIVGAGSQDLLKIRKWIYRSIEVKLTQRVNLSN
jgi:hypothetical protein